MVRTSTSLSFERVLNSPLVKNVVLPIMIMYFILRPLILRIFPSLTANPGNGARKDDKKSDKSRMSISGRSTTAVARAKDCTEFLHLHLNHIKSKKIYEYRSELNYNVKPDTSIVSRIKENEGWESRTLLLSPSEQEEADLLRERLKLSSFKSPNTEEISVQRLAAEQRPDMEVVTISVTLQHVGSDDFHNLIRALSHITSILVFVLVRIEPAPTRKKTNDTTIIHDVSTNPVYSSYDKVRAAMIPLCTPYDNPIFPISRLLVSTSVTGRTAAVRQLKSTIHVDYDHEVCRNMEQHVRTIIHMKMPIVDSESSSTASTSASTSLASESEVSFSGEGIIQINRYSTVLSIQL
jgi:hypothetical protein